MIVINAAACSSVFRQALDALDTGKEARRAAWPQGQVLRKIPDGRIAVFRGGKLSAATWAGPSSVECEATDWVVV